MSTLNIKDQVETELQHWDCLQENLLQILIGVQRRLNDIPDQACDLVSKALSIPRAEVDAVIAFYSFLNTHDQSLFDIRLSDNIVESFQGSEQLAEQLSNGFAMRWESTHDTLPVRIGNTSCIGMCDQGPSALVNGRSIPCLTSEKVDLIIQLVTASVPLKEWPDELFVVDQNLRRPGRLLGNWYQPGDALKQALQKDPSVLIHTIDQSGLRGRGGAGFPTARKWQMCRDAQGARKVVVCNADEGEPGTFKDRLLLQGYADRVIEGMTLCAFAVGADQGFLYLRGEYAYLADTLESLLESRRAQGLLGQKILGREGFDFDMTIHLGAGAYICGEESALIESLEGKRGIPRLRPPFPVTSGYLGRPTVVNNVETFAAATGVAANGADWFRSDGNPISSGSKLFSISGDCNYPGIYEFPLGISVRELLEACDAQHPAYVQVSGPAGEFLTADDFDRCFGFDDVPAGGSVMVFSKERDPLEIISSFMDFFAHESCGFCTPCRVGTQLFANHLDEIRSGKGTTSRTGIMDGLAKLMHKASHCGLGQTAANAYLQSRHKCPELYTDQVGQDAGMVEFDLDTAITEARLLAGKSPQRAALKEGES